MTKLYFAFPLLLIGATLWIIPNMMRRGVFFAVPVADGFESTTEASQARRLFRIVLILGVLAAIVLRLCSPIGNPAWDLAPVFFVILVAAAAFYRANRLVAPFQTIRSYEPSVELSAEPERLPLAFWLGMAAVLLPLAGALYIHAHWDQIPARIPTHYQLDGTPDHWVTKSVKSVYGTLFFALALPIWLVPISLASWFGARRSSVRTNVLQLNAAVQALMAALFTLIALQPIILVPNWLFTILLLAPGMAIILFVMHKAAEPSDRQEPTPQECWKAGVIYFNPADPALFVEKRTGYGYSLNLGNPSSWVVVGCILLIFPILFVGIQMVGG